MKDDIVDSNSDFMEVATGLCKGTWPHKLGQLVAKTLEERHAKVSRSESDGNGSLETIEVA